MAGTPKEYNIFLCFVQLVATTVKLIVHFPTIEFTLGHACTGDAQLLWWKFTLGHACTGDAQLLWWKLIAEMASYQEYKEGSRFRLTEEVA